MIEISTTKMSSKGQVIIPDKIRDLLHLKQGTEFVVLSSDGTVILKPILLPASTGDFSLLLDQARKEAKKAKVTKSALKKTIRTVRKNK